MPWKQTVGWDSNKGGTQSGMCLANVRKGYGIGSKYADAWTSWLNSAQHKNRNYPSGVYAPIYFSYTTTINGVRKNYGHIGVRYPDGRLWTDGRVFASVEDYERQKNPVFVGWGEHVNGIQVIKWEEPPKSKFNMPPIGSRIQLIPRDTRTTFRAGTTTKAGQINVTDNTFIYIVRGYDAKYPNRILINSKSAGGDGVALALYYTNGQIIPGWKKL